MLNWSSIVSLAQRIVRQRPNPRSLSTRHFNAVIRTRGELSSEPSTDDYRVHLNEAVRLYASDSRRQRRETAAEIHLDEAFHLYRLFAERQTTQSPIEVVAREEEEMRRRAEISNVVTLNSAVVHVPTIAELAMVESATAFFATKLLGTVQRDTSRETLLKNQLLANMERYSRIVSSSLLGTDSEFRQGVPDMQQRGVELNDSVRAITGYLGGSVRGSVSVSGAAYLSEDFLRNSLRSICSSYLGFEWDNAAKKLSVHTDSITLSHVVHGTNFTVPLGRFKVVWNAANFSGTNGNPSQFQIFALDEGFHARNNPRVIHPHVSNNTMCPGDAITGVQLRLPAAANGGRISDVFDLIDGLLHNYGAYPYVHLEQWGNHLCPGCRDSIQIDQMVQCFQCAAGHCRSCSKRCEECDRWFCKERCGILDQETRSYTCPCTINTVRCNGCLQRFDPATPLGNMDPVNGFCPHCLYLWITGVTPTAATRVTAQPMPSNPFATPTVAPISAPVPNPTAAAPRRASPTVPVPNRPSQTVPVARQSATARPQRVEFENNYDDLLDSEAALLQQRLASTATEPVSVVQNVQQLAAAVDMLHDINGNFVILQDEVSNLAENTNQRDAVIEALQNIGENEPTLDSQRLTSGLSEVHDVISSVMAAVANAPLETSITTETVPSSNPNRYRDSVTGRWVLR